MDALPERGINALPDLGSGLLVPLTAPIKSRPPPRVPQIQDITRSRAAPQISTMRRWPIITIRFLPTTEGCAVRSGDLKHFGKLKTANAPDAARATQITNVPPQLATMTV